MSSVSQMFRRVALSSSTRRTIQTTRLSSIRPVMATCARPFSAMSRSAKELSTDSSVKTDMLPDDKHTKDKVDQGDKLDVQSANASEGMKANNTNSGGQATEGKDSAGGVAKAKKEHPEAPDPAIGMQDERGGRGG